MIDILFELIDLLDTLIGIIIEKDFISSRDRVILKIKLLDFRTAVRNYREGDGKKDADKTGPSSIIE